MSWEQTFAEQALTSWKDEYALGVVSIPAILCFIPKDFSDWQGGAYYVTEGFAALSGTPWWYQVLLCTMFAHTIGVRWWRRNQYDTENPHESYLRHMGTVAPLQPPVLQLETAPTPVDQDNEGTEVPRYLGLEDAKKQ
jgi:hypothetical protein